MLVMAPTHISSKLGPEFLRIPHVVIVDDVLHHLAHEVVRVLIPLSGTVCELLV